MSINSITPNSISTDINPTDNSWENITSFKNCFLQNNEDIPNGLSNKYKIENEPFIKEFSIEEFSDDFQEALWGKMAKITMDNCNAPKIHLLLGTLCKYPNNTTIGVNTIDFYNDKKPILFINFSMEMVKEQIEKNIFILTQQDETLIIKTIQLKDLFPNETEEKSILNKCASYLLFHELHHVNSFLLNPKQYTNKSNDFYNVLEDSKYEEDIKILFNNLELADDARNTLFKGPSTAERIPGEFELLNTILPKTLRIYTGKFLNFNDKVIQNTCLKLYNYIFDTEIQRFEIDSSIIKVQEEPIKENQGTHFLAEPGCCGLC